MVNTTLSAVIVSIAMAGFAIGDVAGDHSWHDDTPSHSSWVHVVNYDPCDGGNTLYPTYLYPAHPRVYYQNGDGDIVLIMLCTLNLRDTSHAASYWTHGHGYWERDYVSHGPVGHYPDW